MLIKKKSDNGLKMVNVIPLPVWKPLSLLSGHPNRFLGAEFKKKGKFDF